MNLFSFNVTSALSKLCIRSNNIKSYISSVTLVRYLSVQGLRSFNPYRDKLALHFHTWPALCLPMQRNTQFNVLFRDPTFYLTAFVNICLTSDCVTAKTSINSYSIYKWLHWYVYSFVITNVNYKRCPKNEKANFYRIFHIAIIFAHNLRGYIYITTYSAMILIN